MTLQRFSTAAARKWIAQNAFIPNQSDCWPTREVVRAMTEFAESCQPTSTEIEELARRIIEMFADECLGDGNNAAKLRTVLREYLGGRNATRK